MQRARSVDDIPTFPETLPGPRTPLVIDTAAEGFFAVVLAVVVVCLGILGATAARLG